MAAVAATPPHRTLTPSRYSVAVAALAEPGPGVVELHAHLVGAGGHLAVAVDVEALDAEEVVAVARLAVLQVEAPAADAAALGDDHALRAAVGHLDLRGDGVRLVLDADDRALGEAAHAAVEELPVALHERRPPGDFRDEALDATRSSSGSTLYLVASIRKSRCSSASFSGCS